MLHIQIPSDGASELDYNKLILLDLPLPANGFNAEVNNSVVMAFEDEQEAVDYAHIMDEYAETLSDQDSEAYLAVVDIAKAIGDDEFVQTYLQS